MRGQGLVGLHRYDWKLQSELTSKPGGGETLVQQHFAEDVDINTIVRRYGITADMPFGVAQGVYGDFSGVLDYHDAQQLIEYTDMQFMSLPAEVRARFDNDPQKMVDAVQGMSQEDFEAAYFPQPVPAVPAAPEAPRGVDNPA